VTAVCHPQSEDSNTKNTEQLYSWSKRTSTKRMDMVDGAKCSRRR